MSGIKEWWQSISRKWKLVIIFVPVAIVILGVGGVYGSLAYFAANPSACGTCHLMDSYVESYYESDFLDNAHAEADVKCKECHDVALIQIASEGIAFIMGNYELPLEQRQFPDGLCTDCHGSYSALIELTKESTVFGAGVNPHNTHRGEEKCSSCHKVHRIRVSLCAECHDVR